MKKVKILISGRVAPHGFKQGLAISFALHGLLFMALWTTTPLLKNVAYPSILQVTLQNASAPAQMPDVKKPKNIKKAQIAAAPKQKTAVAPAFAFTKQAAPEEEARKISPEKTAPPEIESPEKMSANKAIALEHAETTTTAKLSGYSDKTIIAGESAQGTPPAAIIDTRFGQRGAPSFIYQELPVYPLQARRLGKEGRVLLKLLIDADGKLLQVEVLESAGYGFTEASIEAVKKSTYAPARQYGVKTATRALLPISFRLQ